MRTTRLAGAVLLSLAISGCGQGDADNVMAPDANALSPALVDLALGPELANMAGNELGPTNEVDPATRAGTPTSGAEAADMEPAEEERTRQGRREEEPAEPEPVDTEPPADNSMEPESETTE